MDEKTAWQQFLTDGSPQTYLAYVAAKQNRRKEEQGEVFHQRIDCKREQHGGE